MKKRLHTTLSGEAYKIIEKYLPEYGKVNKLIEEALLAFDRFKKENFEGHCDLLEIMEEANLVAFNAKTVELVVSGKVEEAFCDNEIEIIVRRIYKKPISEITLLEAVKGIENCLLTTRKAAKVIFRAEERGYYLLVTSNLGRNTDIIICEILRRFLEKNFLAKVSFEVFPQGYSLFIEPKDVERREIVALQQEFQSA